MTNTQNHDSKPIMNWICTNLPSMGDESKWQMMVPTPAQKLLRPCYATAMLLCRAIEAKECTSKEIIALVLKIIVDDLRAIISLCPAEEAVSLSQGAAASSTKTIEATKKPTAKKTAKKARKRLKK